MSILTQGKTFLTPNHEIACLTYEEALKRLCDAEYGPWPEGGYYVEITGCTLDEFGDILKAAEEQAKKNAEQLKLWDVRQLQELRTQGGCHV